jgi:hypothetical protein
LKGHLITCLTLDEARRFETRRYVGLGPFYPESNNSKRQILARLRILWDVIADLKRVQPGDICFLHAEGLILGPYIFKSGFYESQDLPSILSSPNLNPENWWSNRDEFENLSVEGYGYVAVLDRPEGCNSGGADLMALFLRQSLGIFNGIPPRFMYGDTKKIVKPLLYHEISQMLEMVDFNGNWTVSPGPMYPLDNLNRISLDLNGYRGHLFCEKILEAWLMENMSPMGRQYQEVVDLIGNFEYYGNGIYTYYTNFLDAIAYNLPESDTLGRCRHCGNVLRNFATDIRLIELKRDRLADGLRTIEQVRGYMEWAVSVLNPRSRITGYLIALGFDEEYRSFLRRNSRNDIQLLRYVLENGALYLQRFR